MDIIDDEEYYERDQTEESKEDDLESQELETDERDYIENPELLKSIDSQKKVMMMILLILILIWRQMMKNLRKYIRQKKEKKMIQNKTNQKIMKYIRQKIWNYLKVFIDKKGYDDDPVDTDIGLETNDE